MTTLFAQPYDITASGFFFETIEDYEDQATAVRNSSGDPVEEFEIQFIDGSAIDAELAEAWRLSQSNLARFFEIAETWDEEDKLRVIIAAGECGYRLDPQSVEPDDFDLELYYEDSLRDLAIIFINDGLFGDIPRHLEAYIDYDAIARDLGMEYTETTIAGESLIYRCG